MRVVVALLIAIVLSFALFVPADAQATTSTLAGTVTADGGKGVPQAIVTLDGAGHHLVATTDANGTFVLSPDPGIYSVTVNKGGFQTASTEVTVAAGARVALSITLTSASLSTLNVIGRTASSVSGNAAKYNVTSTPVNTITAAQIQARNTPSLAQVLQELPGITVAQQASNPNQAFIIRGLKYETTVTIDGHPVSSGTLGQFITNFTPAQIFGGVDVLKGGGLDGPISGESGIGIVNLRTPDFTPKDSGYLQAGLDNYQGTFFTALADVNLGPKISLIAGKSFVGYRGPTFGATEPDGYLAQAPPTPYGTFGAPQNLTNVLSPYSADISDTYSLSAELAKLRFKFSDATSLSVEYLGLQGRYDPSDGAYSQLYGYATLPQCLNAGIAASGKACTAASLYNNPGAQGLIGQSGLPLYFVYPSEDAQASNPNWNADFKTTIGNDTLLLRPYAASVNRLNNGIDEPQMPGFAGNWYQVTNPANCQVASVTTGITAASGAKGPCYPGGQNPVAAYIATGTTPYPADFATAGPPPAGECTVANPCYTTPTTINNSGQYLFGTPFSAVEIDHLFGYTASYIHPFSAGALNLTFDHYYDDSSSFTNDSTPLAAGCTFTLGSTANTAANAGKGYQPNCVDSAGFLLTSLKPSPINVPNTFDSRTSVGVATNVTLTRQLELDAGLFYTRYVINGQQQNPATITPAYLEANYAGNESAVPVQLVGTQNAGSHFDPRFGLVFRPTRDLAVRFSAGSSMTIPYAAQVSGFAVIAGGTITTPNFGLKPEEIVQEDLGADYRYTKNGAVFSWDLYNAVVHNPWLATKIPFCGGPASLGLPPCTLELLPSVSAEGFYSQTLNGAQQYAQGVEFAFTDEPQYGFGYRANLAFERNYYLDNPPAAFGNSAQVYYNGGQFASTGIGTGTGTTSVPYAKGYAEVEYATRGYQIRFGTDYEGNNNEYNAPAFFVFDTGLSLNTGFHNVMISVTGENVLNNTFGGLLSRGIEYQGLSPVAATPSVGGYTYSNPFSTSLVTPGPETWRFSLVKKF